MACSIDLKANIGEYQIKFKRTIESADEAEMLEAVMALIELTSESSSEDNFR